MNADTEDDEVFITSCDLTRVPTEPMTQLKGCVIKSSTISEESDIIENSESYLQENQETSFWEKMLCCKPCIDTLRDGLWEISVRCARVTPKSCQTIRLCTCLDKVSFTTNLYINR